MLAQADVGIASALAVAIEAADVVLMRTDLGADIAARGISPERTLGVIRQNLLWAFAGSVVLILVAAGAFSRPFRVLLSPVLRAAAMGLSSLFALGSAMRLQSM